MAMGKIDMGLNLFWRVYIDLFAHAHAKLQNAVNKA